MPVPINFPREIHHQRNNNKQGDAAKQQRQVLLLDDDKYKPVKHRQNSSEYQCDDIVF
jgi:hypothetical protein